MPAVWDWPEASPLILTLADAVVRSLELVPCDCTKLRNSAFGVRYRASLVKRPGWVASVETAVVEICGNAGYNWHSIV